jgi:Tol biopolymer transport system component
MSEYRDVLERDLERLSPPRIPFEQLESRRDRRRRNQRIRAGVLGVAVALAVALVGAITIRSTAPAPANETPTPSPPGLNAGSDVAIDLTTGEARPLPESITSIPDTQNYRVSPDGRTLLFEVIDETTTAQLYLAAIDGSNVRQLTDEPGGAVAGAWSPDGTKIAYVAGWEQRTSVSLYLLDIATGDTALLAGGLMMGRFGSDGVDVREFPIPSFSPDGLTILFTSQGFFLETVPVSGGKGTRLRSDSAWGSYSPDGTTMAFLNTAGYNGRLRLWDYWGLLLADADGRNERQLVDDAGEHPVWSPDGTRIAYGWRGQVRVVDVTTGLVTRVAVGERPSWLDEDTLIVERYRGRVDDAAEGS